MAEFQSKRSQERNYIMEGSSVILRFISRRQKFSPQILEQIELYRTAQQYRFKDSQHSILINLGKMALEDI